MFGTALAVLSSVATRLHLVGLLVAFGKLKTCRHWGGQIPSPHFTNKQVGAVGFELTTSWSQTSCRGHLTIMDRPLADPRFSLTLSA